MPVLLSLVTAVTLLIVGGEAIAAAPEPWQLGFQQAASPVMERIHSFHNLLLWIITIISVFVLALLAYVCLRFRADRNETPSRRTHNTLLEIAWTAIPVLILVVIAIPSFKLLYFMDVVKDPEMTLKAIGRQWYWSYEYPDHGDFTFDAYMVADEDLEPGQLRLLETDNRVVLPVDTNIRLLVTASDVLHSWAIPAFGVKLDGVPGRRDFHDNLECLVGDEVGIRQHGKRDLVAALRHGGALGPVDADQHRRNAASLEFRPGRDELTYLPVAIRTPAAAIKDHQQRVVCKQVLERHLRAVKGADSEIRH